MTVDGDEVIPEGDGPGRDYRYLNERFYARSPAAYFAQRLNGLLAIAASEPT